MEHRLSEKWIKASIAGTIWAASEIVLGSFFHNLRIPFSGNILTAIGLIILISISYKWAERGLFWRAGLICALLKTMSPSAVIFGPMIAIFFESMLLEISVLIFGRTIAGYLVGSMLAMSWNLFQKIANYLIYYGSDIIEVYNNLLRFAQKQLNIQTDIVWLPIIILLAVYAAFGLAAGVFGIRVGKSILSQSAADIKLDKKKHVEAGASFRDTSFDYSIPWLAANILIIITCLVLLNKTKLIIWCPSITAVITIWAFRYKRALRQLARPKFWIFFVLITLLAAFALTKAQNDESLLITGLLGGLQMNFRAALIITGFSVLGTELYNPRIRNYFLKTPFKNLPLALELSAESLPSFIANIPDFKILTRNPVSIFYNVLLQADSRFAEIQSDNVGKNKIFFVTGSLGAGKTGYAKNLSDLLRQKNISVGGILSERVMREGLTIGYDIVNIETCEREVFLRQDESTGPDKIGRFKIFPEGLSAGNRILASLVQSEKEVIIIDEVGKLELEGNGWNGMLKRFLKGRGKIIIISARDKFTDDIKREFDIKDAVVFDITVINFTDAAEIISGFLAKT